MAQRIEREEEGPIPFPERFSVIERAEESASWPHRDLDEFLVTLMQVMPRKIPGVRGGAPSRRYRDHFRPDCFAFVVDRAVFFLAGRLEGFGSVTWG
jgi:hypothetical protein